ncbi:DUF5403 family protein [Streptomyces sp. NPDC101393]|uniref:DUF5403 family protein n=1 Tax=Streptomyces sp. NPDC101393 TaxID=3366141 RepID=UPI0037F81EE0
MATLRNNLDAFVAHLPPVKKEVRKELDGRAARVRAVVTANSSSGRLARSFKVRTNLTDSTVEISDPAIYAINYGHVASDGSWVEGIHAIEAGL